MSTSNHNEINTNSESQRRQFHLLDNDEGIDIKGWTIRVVQGAIASSTAEDHLNQELGIKLPGMLFDKSSLTLNFSTKPISTENAPSNHPPSFQLAFNAVDALKTVGEADPNIKVKAAERWNSKSKRPDVEITTIEGASDWTFSTQYPGTITADGKLIKTDMQVTDGFGKRVISSTGDASLKPINFRALSDTSLPILFSSQVILFEDELDDNGTASYKVRIRVMPSFLFILARFFLRIDGVLVRIYDTRFYHEFGSDVMVQESVAREANLATDLKHEHPSLLREPDMLAQKVPIRSSQLLNLRLSSEQ